MLKNSSVEDFISYKLHEDKERNLITIDDLRLQHVKMANELKQLQNEQIIDETEFFFSNRRAKAGELSAAIQNRILDETEQEP
jgi:hypothetical protein